MGLGDLAVQCTVQIYFIISRVVPDTDFAGYPAAGYPVYNFAGYRISGLISGLAGYRIPG